MDASLRLQLLRACVRDASFLKVSGRNLKADDFEDTAENTIAGAALKFWEDYSEPIGPLLKSYVQDIIDKRKLGDASRQKQEQSVAALCKQIFSPDLKPVSIKALQERAASMRKDAFYTGAIDNVLEAYNKGELTSDTLAELVERANRELADTSLVATDVLDDDELEGRQKRRHHQQEHVRYPHSLIRELDEKIRLIAKGQVGLFLAPYSSGKGFALVHMSIAYALQNLNVWHITLEDPKWEVEDRIDSWISSTPKSKLTGKTEAQDEKIKQKFLDYRKKIRGRILITDWTEEEATLAKIERGYEVLKLRGFTPDVIIVDYDDEMKVEKVYKGESARRMEFADLYRGQRKLAVKLDVIWWTAAQTGRAGEGKKIITGKDTAEDISKVRKVALAIGIGTDPDNPDVKHLYVIRHRFDRSRFGVDIVSNFAYSEFYDQEATEEYRAAQLARGTKKKKKVATEDD